jgi:branched-chain amino acid transport system permease protein
VEIVVQTIVNGFVLSSIYILFASGFALILSVMRILNFAHGVIYMVGAYVCYYCGLLFGVPPWAAVLLSALIIGLLGLVLEKFGFRPLARDFNRTLMLSLSLIIILQAAVKITAGAFVKTVPPILPGVTSFAGVSLSTERIAVFFLTIILLSALVLVIRKTSFGRKMLAVAQDSAAASLYGVNVNRVVAIGFALSSALSAIAGGFMGSIIGLSASMGDVMLVKAITLVIIGGMGSIGGIFLSGLIVGFIDAVLPIFIGGAGGEVVALALAIIILLVRPQGLFGYEM